MIDQIGDWFRSLKYDADFGDAVSVAFYMGLGGLIALYLRALYRRFGLTISNRDGFSGNFPLLTIATVLVIFVVKSSFALSLGLVGALSIVRFRAAIKEPEEIVYLFFCIAIGLALGAQSAAMTVAGVVVFTVFVLIRHRLARGKGHSDSLLLTVSGPMPATCDGDTARLIALVREIAGPLTVQRLDIESGHVQLRAVVTPVDQDDIGRIVAAVHGRLPGCDISYVNMANLL